MACTAIEAPPGGGRVFATLNALSPTRLILFGGLGDKGCVVGNAMEYDVANGSWHTDVLLPSGSGNVPSPRVRHAAAVHDGVLFVFGGAEPSGNDWTCCREHLYMLEPVRDSKRRFRWLRLNGKGQQPGPRFGHVMCALTSEPALLMFAGSDGKRLLNDLFMFKINLGVWIQIDIDDDHSPRPSAWYSLVQPNDAAEAFLLLGGGEGDDGIEERGVFGGVWQLSHTKVDGLAADFAWTRLSIDCLPAVNVPSVARDAWNVHMGCVDVVHFQGRGDADGQRPTDRLFPLVAHVNGAVFMLGGATPSGFIAWTKLWQFAVDEKPKWTRTSVRTPPRPRVGCSVCVLHGTAVVVGGRLGDGTIADDAYEVHFAQPPSPSSRRLLLNQHVPADDTSLQALACSAAAALVEAGDDAVSLRPFPTSFDAAPAVLGDGAVAFVDAHRRVCVYHSAPSDAMQGPVVGRHAAVARGVGREDWVVFASGRNDDGNDDGADDGADVIVGRRGEGAAVWHDASHARQGHTLTLLPLLGVHVLFGGRVSGREAGSKRDNLWVLDISAAPQRVLVRKSGFATTGLSPESRYGHAACATRSGHCLVVAGGYSVDASSAFLDNAFVLDASTGAWTGVDVGSGAPRTGPWGVFAKSDWTLLLWGADAAVAVNM